MPGLYRVFFMFENGLWQDEYFLAHSEDDIVRHIRPRKFVNYSIDATTEDPEEVDFTDLTDGKPASTKIVKIKVELKFNPADVSHLSDAEIERMLEVNFRVADGLFDLDSTAPADVYVLVETQ